MSKKFNLSLAQIGLILAICLSLAPDATAAPDQVPVWLRARLRQVQQQSYPELEGRSLSMGTFTEAGSFFQSSFEPLSLLGPRPRYRIDLNPGERPLAACPPDALDAVLAHELAHTLDYDRGGPAGTLAILAQLLIDPAPYERRTDLQAMFRGHGPGLLHYRRWSATYLSPEQQAVKARNYLSETEIVMLQAVIDRLDFARRKALEAALLTNPPLDAAQMQRALEPWDRP